MRVLRERVFWFDHPDGGSFGVSPAKGDELRQLGEFVTTDYMTHEGQLVFNAKNGMPVSRTTQNVDGLIAWVLKKLKGIRNVTEQLDDGEVVPMESTPENLERLVREYIGTVTIEVLRPRAEVDRELAAAGDDPARRELVKTTETKEVAQPLYLWLTARVREATDQLREAQRKN